MTTCQKAYGWSGTAPMPDAVPWQPKLIHGSQRIQKVMVACQAVAVTVGGGLKCLAVVGFGMQVLGLLRRLHCNLRFTLVLASLAK